MPQGILEVSLRPGRTPHTPQRPRHPIFHDIARRLDRLQKLRRVTFPPLPPWPHRQGFFVSRRVASGINSFSGLSNRTAPLARPQPGVVASMSILKKWRVSRTVENVHRAVVRNHSPVSSVAALDWVAFAILAALAAAAFARDAAIFAGDLDSPPTDPPSTPLSEAVFCTIAI